LFVFGFLCCTLEVLQVVVKFIVIFWLKCVIWN
jgi:hypothetical protein